MEDQNAEKMRTFDGPAHEVSEGNKESTGNSSRSHSHYILAKNGHINVEVKGNGLICWHGMVFRLLASSRSTVTEQKVKWKKDEDVQFMQEKCEQAQPCR